MNPECVNGVAKVQLWSKPGYRKEDETHSSLYRNLIEIIKSDPRMTRSTLHPGGSY